MDRKASRTCTREPRRFSTHLLLEVRTERRGCRFLHVTSRSAFDSLFLRAIFTFVVASASLRCGTRLRRVFVARVSAVLFPPTFLDPFHPGGSSIPFPTLCPSKGGIRHRRSSAMATRLPTRRCASSIRSTACVQWKTWEFLLSWWISTTRRRRRWAPGHAFAIVWRTQVLVREEGTVLDHRRRRRTCLGCVTRPWRHVRRGASHHLPKGREETPALRFHSFSMALGPSPSIEPEDVSDRTEWLKGRTRGWWRRVFGEFYLCVANIIDCDVVVNSMAWCVRDAIAEDRRWRFLLLDHRLPSSSMVWDVFARWQESRDAKATRLLPPQKGRVTHGHVSQAQGSNPNPFPSNRTIACDGPPFFRLLRGSSTFHQFFPTSSPRRPKTVLAKPYTGSRGLSTRFKGS